MKFYRHNSDGVIYVVMVKRKKNILLGTKKKIKRKKGNIWKLLIFVKQKFIYLFFNFLSFFSLFSSLSKGLGIWGLRWDKLSQMMTTIWGILPLWLHKIKLLMNFNLKFFEMDENDGLSISRFLFFFSKNNNYGVIILTYDPFGSLCIKLPIHANTDLTFLP